MMVVMARRRGMTLIERGHEIASDSMTHRFLPPMRDGLLEEATASKQAH